MSRYLVLQRCAPGTQAPEPPSPDRMQELYAAYRAWRARYQANLVDLGGRLEPGGKVLAASGVTDGPFAEAKEIVGGYMIVAAESYQRAVEIARECPGLLAPGSSTEIRAIADPGGSVPDG